MTRQVLLGVKSAAMKRGAALSDCLTYRWTLTRDWGDGERLCWVMLNPSDADHEIDDPTIRRCIHFTSAWGYGGFTVVNLYPYRSPSPPACKAWATSRDQAEAVSDALRQNATIVADHTLNAAVVVAAWGNNPWDAGLISSMVDRIALGRSRSPDIYCLGTTASGAPKHPMARGLHRVTDDQQPVLWRGQSPA